MVNRVTSLGRHAIGLRVLARDLTPDADVNGVLGFNFFGDLGRMLGFRAGQISLA